MDSSNYDSNVKTVDNIQSFMVEYVWSVINPCDHLKNMNNFYSPRTSNLVK